MIPYLVLNQYRSSSNYKDAVGSSYHFPKRYLKLLSIQGAKFTYYEPRAGGAQVYFGIGELGEVSPDPESPDHLYVEILDYVQFPKEVSYFQPGETIERAKTMRNSVRALSEQRYREILRLANLDSETVLLASTSSEDLELLYANATPTARRVLAKRYERPSVVTRAIKKERGPYCQICGFKGFLMKNRGYYCEVHHLFHLANELPGTLAPKYLIVVCANCHRQLHYADVSAAIELEGHWTFTLAGQEVRIAI